MPAGSGRLRKGVGMRFLMSLLKAIWETEAGHIDPWGRAATPSGDDPGHIDPLG